MQQHHFVNISPINRGIRVLLGLALLFIGFCAFRGTVLGDSLMALSLPFLVTSFSGFCPVVNIFRHHHHHTSKA